MSNFEKGLSIRKEVLGADYVERSLASADAFNEDFQKILTEYCWGANWGREDVLSRRDRSLMNIVLLGAMNRGEEFRLHVRGAITNGCTKEEIRDAIIHLAVYAGVPAGVEAFRWAKQAFADLDQQDS